LTPACVLCNLTHHHLLRDNNDCHKSPCERTQTSRHIVCAGRSVSMLACALPANILELKSCRPTRTKTAHACMYESPHATELNKLHVRHMPAGNHIQLHKARICERCVAHTCHPNHRQSFPMAHKRCCCCYQQRGVCKR
jgi:hypothetical protein